MIFVRVRSHRIMLATGSKTEKPIPNIGARAATTHSTEGVMAVSDDKKVIDHPSTKLAKKIAEQSKEIQALKIDVAVLRDLLVRTVRILAKHEKEGVFKAPEIPDKTSKQ